MLRRKISLSALILVLPSCLLAREEYTRNFDKTLPLRPGQSVLIENKFGDITVHTHPQSQAIIHAEIHVSASDTGHAKDVADRIDIEVEPASSELSIRTRYPESFMAFHNISYFVRYDVTLPEGAPLHIRNSFGAVSTAGVKGSTDIDASHGSVQVSDSAGLGTIHTSFGNVTVHDLRGDLRVNDTNGKIEATGVSGSAELNTTFGAVRFSDIGHQLAIRASNSNITGDHATGPVTIQNSFGSVNVTDIQGGLQITSSYGNVSIGQVRGDANVRTSFALVHAEDVAGLLSVHDTNGSVRASNVHGANVTTSFGAVFLDGVAGPVQVEDQNGAVDTSLTAQSNCQPVIIRTSFSTVRVHVAGQPSYRVTARTSFGKIHSDFPLAVTGSFSSDELTGSIGAGRCEMRLTNSFGPIEILK